MPTSNDELEQQKARVNALREQVADEQRAKEEDAQERENDTQMAALKREEANLEAQLAAAQLERQTAAEAAQRDLEAAEAAEAERQALAVDPVTGTAPGWGDGFSVEAEERRKNDAALDSVNELGTGALTSEVADQDGVEQPVATGAPDAETRPDNTTPATDGATESNQSFQDLDDDTDEDEGR